MHKKGTLTLTCVLIFMSFTFTILPGTSATTVILFEDDMESGINGWTFDGLWHQVNSSDPLAPLWNISHSPDHSWWYGQDATGNYDTGVSNTGSLTSPEIDLTTVNSANLTFWTWHKTETDTEYDTMEFFISLDGGPWQYVSNVTAPPEATWEQRFQNITSFVGHSIQVRFIFDTVDNFNNDHQGWYIDDFAITGSTPEDHDIAVTNLMAPEEVNPNSEIFIKCQITNMGLNDEVNIDINFTVNSVVVNTTKIPLLGAGNSTLLNFSWTFLTEGDYVAGIEVAPVLNENYTGNNEMSKVILVRYTKGYILFDQTHGCDDISNYDSFINNLTAENYNISTFRGSIIEANTFSGIDVFVIPQAGQSYEPSELEAIKNFVISGGGLFVFGDGSPPTHTQLTKFANITWVNGGHYGFTYDIISHEITDGVSSVYLPYPIVARLQAEGDAEALIFDDYGNIMLAYSEQPGRVIGFANENTFNDVYIDEGDNLVLAMNIIKWLASGRFGHDILVSSLEIPKILALKELSFVNATVHNRGLFTESQINIKLTVNGTIVNSTQIGSLNSGCWTQVSFPWSEDTVGIYEVGIEAQPVPHENLTSNNGQFGTVKVREVLGYILFDQTHNTDSIVDYSVWISSLEQDGFVVDTHKSGTISADILKGYDVFVVPNPFSSYSIYEIEAIEEYVSVSGGMLVIGDRSSSFCEHLTEFADIEWTSGGSIGTSKNVNYHEITQGVSSVYFPGPKLKLYVYGDAQYLVRDSSRNNMLAVSEYPGRLAAFVDDQSFKNSGINMANNLILARNIIKWLAINPPAAPSNFSVEMVPEGNALYISWDPNPEPNVAGYVLYRRNGSLGDFFEISNLTGTNYLDTGLLNDVTYYYYAVAFDDEFLYSPKSIMVSEMPDFDTDGDGIYDRDDFDDDNDGLLDNEEDKDRDGIVDFRETDPKNPDTDGDGTNDGDDPLPLDPSQWEDADGDGYGDNPLGNNSDAFPDVPSQWSDKDGDGYGDNKRGKNPDAFPNDPTQHSDKDGDGYGDNATGNNPDAFPDDPTQWSDSDGDGYGDNPDGKNPDEFPDDPGEWKDSDDDGIGDNSDFLPELHNTTFFILLAIIVIICIVLLLVAVLIKKGKIKLPEKKEPEPIPPSTYPYQSYPQPQDASSPPYPPPPSEFGPYGPQIGFGGTYVPAPPPIPPPPPATATDITTLLDDLLVTSEISEDDYLTLKEKLDTPEWNKTINDMLVEGKITAKTHSELNNV